MGDKRLGIDIGGSGIKGAVVDLADGSLVTERVKFDTPQPATPQAMGPVVAEVVAASGYRGPIGVGFPAVIIEGVARTANNIDRSWIGVSVLEVIQKATGSERLAVANDADAAALCEGRYGAARGVSGLVIVVTFGSGIGSGFLADGKLVANTELGVLELDGFDPAESHFSAKARKADGISWEEWGRRANRFLSHVSRVFNPELIVVGGGAGRRWERWSHQVDGDLPVVRAQWANDAGIVGAATLVGD